MAGRRHTRYFSEMDKADLLAAIRACRSATIRAQTKLDPTGDMYRACLRLDEAIDDLAGLLTGDREHFHLKSGPSIGDVKALKPRPEE